MDPHPIKTAVVLIARVRDALEPALLRQGFAFENRNNPQTDFGPQLWLDYARAGETLSLRWNQWVATLSLELLSAAAEVQILASLTFDHRRSYDENLRMVDKFVNEAQAAIARLDQTKVG